MSGLPTVQSIGQAYPFSVTVTNNSKKWIKFFCLDFNDDGQSLGRHCA